jgi:hypothetical protein
MSAKDAFLSGYEAGKKDAIDQCLMEKVEDVYSPHNLAVNLCVEAIRELNVRYAEEKWK